MKKNDITVDCKRCIYTSSSGRGNFQISVPVIDSKTGLFGSASLECSTSRESHTVELLQWQGFDKSAVPDTADLRQRISAALEFLAERKICGNRKICPAEVVRIVEDSNAS